MAVPKRWVLLLPALLALAACGLLYTGVVGFRVRDPTEVCHSATGRCTSSAPAPAPSSTGRTKRAFQPVSTRGSFVKLQPPDDEAEEGNDDSSQVVNLAKRDVKAATRPWSKLVKIVDNKDRDDSEGDAGDGDNLSADEEDTSSGRIDSDDEIVQIEVEEDDGFVIEEDDEEDRRLREKLKREEERRKKEKEEDAKRKREKAEQERRRKEKEEQERRKRAEDEKKRRERELEMERKRKEEEEERRRRERELEEARKREEEERQRKQEEEERRRKAEEEERRRKEEEELRRKEEEEERKRKEEEEERQRKEEEERRRREENERKQEEERKRREEEKREAERKKQEEEDERKKKEEERIRKKREEEEKLRKKKEEEEKMRKKKEEEEKMRKKREEEDAERIKDEIEDKKRLERLKKQAEDKKLREEEEKRKRAKPKKVVGDDDEDEDESEDNGDEESVEEVHPKSAKPPKETGAVKLLAKTKPEKNGASTKSKSDKSIAMQKTAIVDETKINPKARQQRRDPEVSPLSLAELNDALLSVPSFVPNFTAAEDPVCQQHGKIFLRQLRGYKLWALQMLDSSAKIPAGLLRGNINQLGDFDQCLGVVARVKVDAKTVKVQGKYCLANIDLYATHSAAKVPVNLMQSRALIRGSMRDPGHFIPRFTTANWALCLPAACTAEDAQKTIEDALNVYNFTAGMKFVVNVDPGMCYVKQKTQSYSKETIGVLYFYAMFICLAIVATIRDYFAALQEKGNYSERIIMAFSLKRTLKALFDSKEASPNDIGCIHGIRSLSTIALYVAHKLIPTSRMPYANRIALTEAANTPLSVILRASLFYTDSFLLLSGVLTAFNMAKELSSQGEIRWFCRFVARFMRLTPSLLAVVFWYAFVMEHIGSGPQWNLVVKANADICKENAWINLLYVQNFFPFEEMCATHTHQLALDMQLSLAAPALVFFLQIKPIVGIILVFFLLQVSATLRYLATSNNNLSLVIFHGMTIKHLYKTANLTYALPLHRATPYLFGISVGVLMHHTGKNVRIHKVFNIIGWSIAIALGSWSLLSPWRVARRDYVYDVDEATHYAVISPILSSLALCWAIFACFTNNGGAINRLLSSYWMVVFSKMSYAIYLSQFAVFFYNVGSARYSSEFQTSRIIDPYEAMSVALVSVALTLLFDIPMQEVKNIIMECGVAQTVEVEKSKESHISEENHNNVSKVPQDLSVEEDEDESEPSPGGWNWNRGTFIPPKPGCEENGVEEAYRSSRIKRQDIRRQTMIRSEAYDEWSSNNGRRRSDESVDDGRTSRSEYRTSNAGLEDENGEYLHPRERYFSSGYTRSPMRDLDAPIFRRSASRERVPMLKEPEIPPRKPLITISTDDDYQISRSPRSSVPRFSEQQRSLSSESETEALGNRRGSYSRRSADPRIADDEDWEDELRLRRARYLQERVSSQERDRVPPPVPEEEADEDEWNSLKRRSSAEGKLALLKEPLRPGNMDLWTVSKMQLGSSQEPDEDEIDGDLYHRREYREQGPPLREEFEGEEEDQGKSYASESLPTSFEEEDDPNHEFTLKKDSKRITVQDLSKIPADDEALVDNSWNKLDVKTTSSGLFKRESIVKSQASEEDPEYLLPERPKLVEQEQEHPFKKAWQMQKSRSEEEGSSAFVIKESKSVTSTLEKQKEEPEEKADEEQDREGAQSEELVAPDVSCDVTIVWQARSHDTDETKSTTKSESSSTRSSRYWPDDEEFEECRNKNRRKSEEENWTWTERDT